MERANSVGEEVERLVEGLMRRAMRERAIAVEAAMEEVVRMCKGCLAEVFELEDKASGNKKDEDEMIELERTPREGDEMCCRVPFRSRAIVSMVSGEIALIIHRRWPHARNHYSEDI